MAQFPLIDQASLAMIPGAYKESKVYSQLPTDGSGDFTFTRATSATRVNEEGYIEKGYENTLLGSNDWARDDSSYTITGGEAGYDGTNDAWLVNKLAAAYFNKDGLVLAGVMTVSFFAKAGSLDRIFVFIGGDAARFDLTNGEAFSAGGATVSQNIELVSGTTDWYRCSIIINKTGTHNFLIKPQNSSNQDVTGTIYIQDGMLNQGLVAYPYLETTAAPVYGGLQAEQPRLDYKDASCPSVLIEPSRTNFSPHSEYYGTLTTYGSRLSYEQNVAISPENVRNSFKAKVNTGELSGSGAFSGFNSSFSKGDIITISVFLKADEFDEAEIGGFFGSENAKFNLNDGSVISQGTNAINAYSIPFSNNWYRCVVTYTFQDSINNRLLYSGIRVYAVSNGTSLLGDGVKGVLVYGGQIELGSFPTSYTPTYGSTQTRAAETLSNAFSAASTGTISLSLGKLPQPYLTVLGESFEAGTTKNNIAIAYSPTALKISLNGSIVVDATGTYDTSSLSSLQLGHDNGSDQGDNPIKDLIMFNAFLTDTELNALTV